MTHRDEPPSMCCDPRHVDGDSAVSSWLEAFTELHRLLRTAAITRRRSGRHRFPTEFFPEARPGWWPSSRWTRCRRSPAGSRPSDGRPPATPSRVHDGPMVDLEQRLRGSSHKSFVDPRPGLRRGSSSSSRLPFRCGNQGSLIARRTKVYPGPWPRSPSLPFVVGVRASHPGGIDDRRPRRDRRLLSAGRIGTGAWTGVPDVTFSTESTTLSQEPGRVRRARLAAGSAGDLRVKLIQPVRGRDHPRRVPRGARARAAPRLLRGRRRRRRRARRPRRPGSRC